MMHDIQKDATIDVRDSISPISLLMVENRLAKMQSGQFLEVLCGDTETKGDLVRIIKNSGHRCIAVTDAADHFSLLIEKRASPS
jgi:TusA-related sulfurtransferase